MPFRRITLALAALLLAQFTILAADSPKPKKTGSFLDWGDSPEAYFLTGAERADWLMVHSQEQADAFIASYWARHPGLHAELQARIAAADKYFPLGDLKGSETQRGRVFIILGPPNRQQSNRNDNVASSQTFQGNPNSIEQRAVSGTTWIYKNDRLPKDLGVAELTVKFQTDVSRGYEVIENPGLIEPYLTRAVDYFMKTSAASSKPAAPSTPTQVKAAVGAAPVPPDDAVWNAGDALKGAIVTGDSYVSPTDKPFYAVSFYLPKSSFTSVGDVTVAGVIRDGSGQQVASVRTPAKAAQYDANGDRFVDASFELPAGHYTGAFALATADGKVLSSAKNEFDVMPAEHVGVSKILMTSRIDTLDKQQAFDPFTFVAMKYAVKGDRRFHTADKIGYFTTVANPTAAPNPSMSMKMKVSLDGKVVDAGSWMPVELTQTGPHTYLLATQFEPNSLSPGHYAIEVQLRDMKADKTTEAYTKGYLSKAEFEVVQ